MYTTNITLTNKEMQLRNVKCKQLHIMLKRCPIPDTLAEFYMLVGIIGEYVELSNIRFLKRHYGPVNLFVLMRQAMIDWDIVTMRDIFENLLVYVKYIENISMIDVFMYTAIHNLRMADLNSVYIEIINLVEEYEL